MLAFLAAAVFSVTQAPDLGIPAKYRTAPPSPETVVMRVNGQEVRAGDLGGLIWSWSYSEVSNEVATYLLVRADAASKGVFVGEEAVETALDERLKMVQAQVPQGQSMDQFLQSQGFTRSRLYLRVHTELMVEQIVARQFDPKNFVQVSTMVFRVASEQAEALQKAIQDANTAYERLQKGEGWAKVLESVTTDERIRQTEGRLGWRELAAFPPTVQTELRGLNAGGVTKPAQTPNGIQIFRLEATGAAASDEEVAGLRQQYLQSSRERYLAQLRENAKIERLFAPK